MTFFHRALISPSSAAEMGLISIRDPGQKKWLTFSVVLGHATLFHTGSATPTSGCGRTDATFVPSVIAFASVLDTRISTKSCGGSPTPLRETLINQSFFVLTPWLALTLLSLHQSATGFKKATRRASSNLLTSSPMVAVICVQN